MISMVQMFKQFFLVVVLVAGINCATAFVLIGPDNEAYQDNSIGYNPNPFIDRLSIKPKFLGEEYRPNIPVIFYTFDQNFLDYFGSNGVAAVEDAFAILNQLGQTNLSAYNLDDIPMESARLNYKAAALSLSDVKSAVLNLMTEQRGLTHPDRYVWTIHSREHFGTIPCPVGMQYIIQKMNYDPIPSALDTFQQSSYVNGTLYTYSILEYCQASDSPIPPMLADAIEIQVDPLATTFSAVAAGGIAPIILAGSQLSLGSGLNFGSYYTGLTRDDVGGFRYLLRTNNWNWEAAGADTVTFITNNSAQLLFTSNLTEFVSAALTNDAAALSALFPNLQITQTFPFFTNVVSTNFINYLTNYPQDPYGTTRSVTVGVVTTNIQTWYSHEFLNVFITPTVQLVSNLNSAVVTGHLTKSNLVTVLTTNISLSACSIGSPYTGLPCTNISLASFWSNGIAGDYFILPSNLCSVALISTQLIQNISVTNATVVATNAAGTTNLFNESFSQTSFYNYNRYVYVVKPVTCPVDSVALRQGIEKIQYVRRDYDSLLGTFFYPTNHDYVLNSVTNNTLVPQSVRRRVTRPDILFTAEDLTGGAGSTTLSTFARTNMFKTANVLNNLAGPGTINGPTVIVLNKVGPAYANVYPLLTENDQIPILIWGSFDGSTNSPVVYPNGTSTVNLENQVLIQITPPTLPSVARTVNYSTVFTGFTVAGATAPFSWVLSPGSAGLPIGLSLNPISGTITGSCNTSGTYDFSIRMTDSASRYVDRNYSITITP